MKTISSLFLHVAPAGTPSNPMSTTINATAIQVQWEPVPEIDQNGIITLYEVRVDPAQFQDISYVNLSGSELVLVVDGLEEFVEYNFTVRAYTIAGPGPFGVITTSTTDQAGERDAHECEKSSVLPQSIYMYALDIFPQMIFTCWNFAELKASELKRFPNKNKVNGQFQIIMRTVTVSDEYILGCYV